jgi:hypothetical protein
MLAEDAMAVDPRTSQYSPGLVGTVVDELSDTPDYLVVEEAGLGDADMELLYRVCEAIGHYEPIRISGSTLRLSLHDGAVVLAGRVRSDPLKILAERLAASAVGGRPFVNELISDAAVTVAVATALALDARTSLAPVFVETNLGQVTLYGDAPSAAMVTAATEVASAVPGVATVTNYLVARAAPAPPTPAEVKAEAGATSQPIAETAYTSEPRLEPHSREQNADRVTRPAGGDERVPVADT